MEQSQLYLNPEGAKGHLSAIENLSYDLQSATQILRAALEQAQAGDPHGYLTSGLHSGFTAANLADGVVAQLQQLVRDAVATINDLEHHDAQHTHIDVVTLATTILTKAMQAAKQTFHSGNIEYTQELETTNPNLDTTYRIGPPKRPDIYHDEGFPDNIRKPDWSDRLAYAKWLYVYAEGAEATRNIPDGISAYRHFMDATGEDRQFSYERFVDSDPHGKLVLEHAIADSQYAAQDLYQHMIAADPELRHQSVTFQMTSEPIFVGADKFNDPNYNPDYEYPATENWQKAIGAHPIWLSATVTVHPGTPDHYSMDFTLHAEDKYNFNPGAKDIATLIDDKENGRFEETGLAKEYMNYAELERTITWSEQTNTPQQTDTTGEPTDRERAPQNNTRLRNRL